MIFIKRALEYLKKKIGKTILMSIIFIVIANFIIAGLLIQNASENAQNNTRLAIGADITYEIDITSFMSDIQKGLYDREELMKLRNGGLFTSESVHEGGGPTIGNIESVVNSEYVSEYFYSLDSVVTSDLKSYNLEDLESSDLKVEAFGAALPSDLKDGTIQLLEGTLPTDNQALINETLAQINNLRLGDTIELTFDIDGDQKTITQVITGIYSTEETVSSVNSISNYPENKIYVPLSIYDALGMSQEDLSHTLVSNTVIRLNDPSNLDLYRAEMEGKVDFKYGYLDANDDLYESLVGPLESIGLITKIFVVSIILTGGFIVGLITALTINDRKNEIGILLAVGESKLKIVSQFVLEVTIIAVLAFSLSLFTGQILGESMSNTLLSSEVFTTEESSNQAFVKNVTSGMRGGQGSGANMPTMTIPNASQLSEAEAAAEMEIGLDYTTILQIFTIGLLLTVVSTSVPTIYVMRFSPKQILTNRDS